jgi:Restriction endonuclease
MAGTLSDEFDALLDLDPQQRGYRLETLVAKLFRQAHFEIDIDPPAAAPRQTDLLARGDQSVYLIETRWRGKPAGSGDVDDLHARLKRTPSRVEGILVSVEGFTPQATTLIEELRHERLVIPIDADSLREFLKDPRGLPMHLQLKRDSLVVYGSVAHEPESAIAIAQELPSADLSILHPEDGGVLRYVSGGGSYSGLTFYRELPDIDWVAADGHGVTCDLQLAAQSQEQLLGVIKELSEIGWAGPEGQWTITQSERVWHGFGAHSLGLAVEAQASRLDELDQIHSSEELFYVDQCEGGFYTLSARPLVHSSRVWPVQLSFQLPGIPLDTGPFRRFADRSAPGTRPYFRPRSTPSTAIIRLPRMMPLDVVAMIVESDEGAKDEVWVVGVVARNPFFSDLDRLGGCGMDPVRVGGRLDDHELLICDLRSWHPVEMQRDYVLRGFDLASTSDVTVIRPRADWAPEEEEMVDVIRVER